MRNTNIFIFKLLKMAFFVEFINSSVHLNSLNKISIKIIEKISNFNLFLFDGS